MILRITGQANLSDPRFPDDLALRGARGRISAWLL